MKTGSRHAATLDPFVGIYAMRITTIVIRPLQRPSRREALVSSLKQSARIDLVRVHSMSVPARSAAIAVDTAWTVQPIPRAREYAWECQLLLQLAKGAVGWDSFSAEAAPAQNFVALQVNCAPQLQHPPLLRIRPLYQLSQVGTPAGVWPKSLLAVPRVARL